MRIPSRASPGCSSPPASRMRRRARRSRSSSPGCWPTGSSSPHRSTTRRCRRPWSRSSRRRSPRSRPEGPSHGPSRSPVLSGRPPRAGPATRPETARRPGVSRPVARLRALGHRHRGHDRRRAAQALGAGAGRLRVELPLDLDLRPGRAPLRGAPLHLRDARHHRDRDRDRAPARPRGRGLPRRAHAPAPRRPAHLPDRAAGRGAERHLRSGRRVRPRARDPQPRADGAAGARVHPVLRGARLRGGALGGGHSPRGHDRPVHRQRVARGPARGPADAARRGPGTRRDALGDGARRGRPVRALGYPGLGLPRPGARARRDDGGDDGDRQPARALRLALRSRLHDGGRARQRVHRGDERRLPRRAGRDRARAVRDHARGERARAAPDRQRPRHARRPTPMNATYRHRRRVERLMFGATAGATFATLGVLVFLLGYIAWQGATSLSWSFFTALPAPVGHFSTLAGGVALGVMMVPVALRSTEEFLRLVPDSLREAALALGAPRWVTIVHVVIPAASRGITTGLLLSLARVAGETAPLLFTALNNRFWSPGWLQPTASLPVMIFTYAIAPYEDWHRQAWAAGLVLLALVLGTNVLARFLLRGAAVRSA